MEKLLIPQQPGPCPADSPLFVTLTKEFRIGFLSVEAIWGQSEPVDPFPPISSFASLECVSGKFFWQSLFFFESEFIPPSPFTVHFPGSWQLPLSMTASPLPDLEGCCSPLNLLTDAPDSILFLFLFQPCLLQPRPLAPKL